MNDADFIIGLMKRNTDALGFIPAPDIRNRFVRNGWYLIQRNRFAKPVGYLIHGPSHPNKPCHIHQACIDLDRRNRGFGLQMVATLVDELRRCRTSHILLRCALDLAAIDFWIQCSFAPYAIVAGGMRRNRTIVKFTRGLHPSPRPLLLPAPGISKVSAGRQLDLFN